MSTDRFQDEQRAAAMPEVLRAVEVAVARRRAPSRLRRRLLRGAGLSLVAALASGTALAATGQWNPFGGGTGRNAARAIYSPPPADQLEVLAVLRRPQTGRDRNPIVAATLRKVPKQLGGGVRVNAARELRVLERNYGGGAPFQEHMILLSLERFGAPDRTVPDSSLEDPLCIWGTIDVWPEGRDRPIDYLSDAGGQPTGDALLPKERSPDLDDRITTGGSCGTAHQLRTKGIQTGTLSMGYVAGLVPDAVATVRATASSGAVLTARVENNYYELQAPVFDNGRWGVGRRFKQGSLQWVAADGHVIRTF